MISGRKYIFLSLIALISIGTIFFLVNYTGKEGFNPSDDGVILAQSWRILNGEVPHKDFIAMKPALSGFLHTIHFYSPLAMEDSARWFVVFQNFMISFLWVYLLMHAFGPSGSRRVISNLGFIPVAIIAFTLNLNHHGLFPWTTVDGLFWGVISTVFFISIYDEGCSLSKKSVMAAVGIFFMSLALLSRQTFVFPLILLDFLVLFHFLKLRKYLQLAAVLLFGQLPVIIYLIYLFKNDAFALFLNQMSGRTELFEVGFLQYIKSFLKSRLLLLNLPILVYLLWYILKNFRKYIKTKYSILNILPEEHSRVISILAILWFILCLSLSVNMLIVNDPMNQANPFELFFLMLTIQVSALIAAPLRMKQRVLLFLGLILCWSTSLSLGSNSPVYCLGIVVSTTLILALYLVNSVKTSLSETFSRKAAIFLLPASIAIFILGIVTQARINYRDKPASELECRLNENIPSMGCTLTNANLCNYYTEFLKIYNAIPAMKDHFLLLPNNAMIYPALRSRNPFPVDWAQHDEYIGQENRVLDMIKHVLQKGNIYILIDKYNVESIAYNLYAVDYLHYSANQGNDLFVKKYKVNKYDYMPLISEYCEEVPVNYSFFHLYVTKMKK